MKNYELTFLVSPLLSEQEVALVQKKISSFVEENKGEVAKTSNPIKKALGDKIDKNSQAYLCELSFSLNPEAIVEVKKKLAEETDILRYMILTKKKELREKRERPAKKESLPVKESKTTKKTPLGDIDKKIDEILSE